MVEIFIGILMILSFLGMIFYCVKGHNLMIGFFLMATLWTGLALLGGVLNPDLVISGANGPLTLIQILTFVYQTGPGNYATSILVNIFFGALFGRVLMDTGIAGTLIRKVVELGGDKPRVTMVLLCIVTAFCFTSMTGIGPVISIAVIVLPIMQSLGIASPIALFAFMGSIMAGTIAGVTNFAQFKGILSGLQPDLMANYEFADYFTFGAVGMAICLIVVLVVANLALNKNKPSRSWAAATPESATVDAPWYSWISVVLPVVLIVTLRLPIIFAFILSGIYALLVCGKFKGTFVEVCRMFSKMFVDGVVDVAPMLGFLLCLSMFNQSANYAAPYFKSVVGGIFPTSTLMLALLFALIIPLGFFRGPTNLVGCGTAIAAVVLGIAPWNVMFIYPVFAVATLCTQHLDITQSWLAWGLGYTKVGSKEFMKFSIPTGWISGAICVIVAFVMYGSL